MKKVPIYEMLKNYSEKHPLPFHMPGHILGRGLIGQLKMAGELDITEIPGADCLHSPDGVIKEAQALAAECFGADYTLFMVNGSTSGIHAMIGAVVKPGGKLIVGRDCHVSVLNALAMFKAEPVFVLPEVDKIHGISLGVSYEALENALRANPDVQGILVTSPNYYGISLNLRKIAELAEGYRVPLLVDEAHGAHFRFYEKFPEPAISSGADLCVQSLHKTLPALTQTALLHGREKGLVDRKRVEKFASMVQTTSPSYVLMASMDLARDNMEALGKDLYHELWLNIKDFECKLQNTAITRVNPKEDIKYDFSRIVLSFKNTKLTGLKAGEILFEKYGIVAEMADLYNVVLIATPYHKKEDFERLLIALEEISKDYPKDKNSPETTLYWPNLLPEKVLSIHEALYYKVEEVPIKEAVGSVCGASIVPYPPGIPILNAGEKVTGEIAQYLVSILDMGYRVNNVNNGRIPILNGRY